MAKRLTDTKKWNNPSFRKLPTKYKVLYLYLLDNCDSAGVIHIDIELFSVLLGNEFSLEEIKREFAQRLIFVSEEKAVIRNYIAFQNGDIFDGNSNIAKSIRANLNSHGLLERYQSGEFGNVIKGFGLWD